MPRELVALAPRKPVLREYEEKPLPPGHVRVRVEYGAPKRGTELTHYRGDRPASFPMGLGNMCVGRIVELGEGVTGWQVGDRVAGYGHLRETHTWRADRLLRLSERMTWKEAVCYDPAQFAFGAVRDGHVRVGDRVAVFGLGAIGQMAVQLARVAGASLVAAVDPIPLRREVAQRTGADLVLDPTAEDVPERLKEATDGLGLDVAIETSASYQALDTAIRALAWGGTVAVAGWMKECRGGLNLGDVAHFIIPNLVFTRACSDPNRDHPRWSFERICRQCWEWLAAGKFQCEEIVQPVVPFDQAVDAYIEMDEHPERSIKLGVAFS